MAVESGVISSLRVQWVRLTLNVIPLECINRFLQADRDSLLSRIEFCWALFSYGDHVEVGIDFNSLWAVETLRAARFALVFDCCAIDRTLDRGLAYTPLAGVRLQPLGHLSKNARKSYHTSC